MEKNIVGSGQIRRRVIEHFLLETDATFNTSRLNMPLSVLLGIINTGTFFPAAYCYITSDLTKLRRG